MLARGLTRLNRTQRLCFAILAILVLQYFIISAVRSGESSENEFGKRNIRLPKKYAIAN